MVAGQRVQAPLCNKIGTNVLGFCLLTETQIKEAYHAKP